jgi:DNA oxidative demethylase
VTGKRAPPAALRTPRARHPTALGRRRVDDSERNYLYLADYLTAAARSSIETWLATLRPLWELRYSTVRSLPPGRDQRPLLRPVYWLGNWQFACLGYYEPPHGFRDRCVAAEPFPPCLAGIARDAEARVRVRFSPADVPRDWHLNTCLVNFYGDRQDGDQWSDVARVGDHRDFEPGPVVSLSLGERALFQFVARGRHRALPPARTQWLDDGSLQAFAGRRWKDELLHRVQRVDRRSDRLLPPAIDGFRTRRINFTFRYVPTEHVVPWSGLSPAAQADIRDYVTTLAKTVPHFARALSTIPHRVSKL